MAPIVVPHTLGAAAARARLEAALAAKGGTITGPNAGAAWEAKGARGRARITDSEAAVDVDDLPWAARLVGDERIATGVRAALTEALRGEPAPPPAPAPAAPLPSPAPLPPEDKKMLTRDQIQKFAKDAKALGDQYEKDGNAAEAQVHWNLANQWNASLDAPGRADAPEKPGFFAAVRAKMAGEQKPAIDLPPQIIIAEAAPPKAKAPGVSRLAAAFAMPGALQAPPAAPARPLMDRAAEMCGDACKWVGVTILGAGIGYLVVRTVGGKKRGA